MGSFFWQSAVARLTRARSPGWMVGVGECRKQRYRVGDWWHNGKRGPFFRDNQCCVIWDHWWNRADLADAASYPATSRPGAEYHHVRCNMNLKKSSLDWGLGLWWVLATAVGWAGGWAVITWASHLYWGIGVGIDVAFVAYVVLGTTVGIMQWLVLRRRVPRSGLWILACAVSITTGSYVSQVMWMYDIIVFGAVFGVLVGITQWSVMRRWVHRAGWWVPASVIGWVLGWFATSAGDFAAFLIGGIAGIITGFALAMLFKHPVQQAPLVQRDAKYPFLTAWVGFCALTSLVALVGDLAFGFAFVGNDYFMIVRLVVYIVVSFFLFRAMIKRHILPTYLLKK